MKLLDSIIGLFRRKPTPKFLRGLKRFRKRYPESRYPNYIYGTGTYTLK